MIKFNTDGPKGEAFEAWSKRASNARDAAIKASNAGEKVQFNDSIWRDLKPIFLVEVFHEKCAYCEGNYCAGHSEHVEHYRPKSEVTENRTKIAHQGYYWLAYEWFNLLLSCANCNSGHSEFRNGKKRPHPGKDTEFRIKSKRIVNPSEKPTNWLSELSDEQPLLLNPYFDNPSEHIYFANNGYVHAITERGKETIKVCDLNRIKLVEARKKAKEKIFRRVFIAMERKNPGRLFRQSDEFSAWLNHCALQKLKPIAQSLGYDIIPLKLNSYSKMSLRTEAESIEVQAQE